MNLFSILLLTLCIYQSRASPITLKDNIDVEDRLNLTPYFKNGQIEKAKELSIVNPKILIDNITSYAGYLTVNENHNSHLWFWYFPVKEGNVSETPLVIWLQGGPGQSSLYGLFREIGPFKVDSTGSYLIANEFSWHLNQSVLFIDSPVGTGFSITNDEGYATNQTIIAEHLYEFLTQFYQIFHELQRAPLFIAGESYGGKHVPSLAYEIHKHSATADLKINLQGLAIGNGYIDPIATSIGYSDYLYQTGMIDESEAKKLKILEEKRFNLILNGKYKDAFWCDSEFFTQYVHTSGIENVYDIRKEHNSLNKPPFITFVQLPKIRKALHVGNSLFSENERVLDELLEDVHKSYKYYLEEILEHYRVMLFTGQFDVRITYPMTIKTIKNLKWSGLEEYLKAPRKKWGFGDVVAGYTKQAGNLLEVLVRNAGHSVPINQPERILSLMQHFIKNEPIPEGNASKMLFFVN